MSFVFSMRVKRDRASTMVQICRTQPLAHFLETFRIALEDRSSCRYRRLIHDCSLLITSRSYVARIASSLALISTAPMSFKLSSVLGGDVTFSLRQQLMPPSRGSKII